MQKNYSKELKKTAKLKPEKEVVSFLLNYSKALKIAKKMKPDKEVVSLLLNYSKALKIVKVEGKVFEVIVN